jgi:peptide/nickel transport system substrate-binding protein
MMRPYKQLNVYVLVLTFMVVTQFAFAFNESPYLANKGLPPVAERLPTNPMVIAPFEGKTNYGGTLRIGIGGTNPGWGGLWYLAGWETLVFWTPDMSNVQPNIAESWEVSEDVRSYTFKLREGMKWSDGAPFTADDIMFYIEDVLLNEELNNGAVTADWLPESTGDKLQVEKLDDYTVEFTFAEPNGTFLYTLATFNGRQIAWYPKHYLSQFHPKYNDNLDELVSAAGKGSWTELFQAKAFGPVTDTVDYFSVSERPTLFPWIVKTPIGTGTQITMERNPYYWKVDEAGNQLPYIDEIIGTVYEEGEARTLAMLNGELDYIKDPGSENRSLYFSAVDEGKPLYIRTLESDGGNTNSFHINQTTKDPALAEVFVQKDFRIGLSYAINREEIIEIVHNGQGIPAQAGPLETSPLYNEQLTTQYTEYNVDLANEALDKVLPEKDADGFRLGSNDERFSFAVTVANDLSFGTFYVQVAELLKEYFAAVGVEMQINSVTNEQFEQLLKTNDVEATLFTDGSAAGILPIIDPVTTVPGLYHGHFGNAWYGWLTKSSSRVQDIPMPDNILALRNMYDEEVLRATSPEAQVTAMKKVLQASADQFFVIGISRHGELYYPFSTRVGNIPETWIDGWLEGVTKLLSPEQWVIQE